MAAFTYEVVEIEDRGAEHLNRELRAQCADGQRVAAVIWRPNDGDHAAGWYEVWLETAGAKSNV